MKAATLAFVIALLRKLTEKTSIASYLTLITTLVAKQYSGDVANVAALISATATIILFVVSDTSMQQLLTGSGREKVPLQPSVPQPVENRPVNDPTERKA